MEPDVFGKPIKRLRMTFADGHMRPNWANSVFDTVGIQPPALDRLLPEYRNDPTIQDEYREILDPLLIDMESDSCKLHRIEGRFERIEKLQNRVKRRHYIVRGVYLAGVVKSSTGGNTDLVVFVGTDPNGGGAPDGGATGPPKPP
jgi:hypothetical protein